MEDNNISAGIHQSRPEEVKPEPEVREIKQARPAGYGIAFSIIFGALLISASIFYCGIMLSRRLDGVAFSGQVAGAQTVQTSPAGSQPKNGPVAIQLKPDTPFLGSASAKVAVVEFADYQCPYCEQFYTSIWPELKSKYIDTGKVKFYYQDFAFLGADSNTAAEAAHCAADQNKFWQYHDYLFGNQGRENTGWAAAARQKQFAAAVGLNMFLFNQCLDSGKYKQEVLDETAAGRGYGVGGTPTLFINGAAMVGALPAASFEQAIDKALLQ